MTDLGSVTIQSRISPLELVSRPNAVTVEAHPQTITIAVQGVQTASRSLTRITYALPVEVPNGNRVVFTAPFPFVEGSLVVALNGLVEPVTALSSTQFEFAEAPWVTDQIWLDYIEG